MNAWTPVRAGWIREVALCFDAPRPPLPTNGGFDWAGSVRLLGADDKPVPGIRVTLDPDEAR
ncbi:MAG: hypothetical protein K9N62_11150 [Verrucomicrobia bacterium]|nr:hypothetical protein [Verrucomicrobiota bacterium]